MTSSTDDAERPRRRVRVALAVLERVRTQRESFAAAYATARTAQDRFGTAATALRAAGSERTHQNDPAVARRFDAITSQIIQLLEELHEQQEHHANRVVRTDERRQARNERRHRAHCDEQSTA